MVPRLIQSLADISRRQGSGPRGPCFQSKPTRLTAAPLCGMAFLILSATLCSLAIAETPTHTSTVQHRSIPILGTTVNQDWEEVGVVAEVNIRFESRSDHDGLQIYFDTTPGRFSQVAQQAVLIAIERAAEVSRVNPESWSITLTFPYPGVTMYGESLSAMVGLSVLALAKGDPLPPDRVVTGTITADGHIGTVGGVPLKIVAAWKEHLRRVLIPEEQDVGDGDWQTPFLMHVSPVDSVDKAYKGLTGRPIHATLPDNSSPYFPVISR